MMLRLSSPARLSFIAAALSVAAWCCTGMFGPAPATWSAAHGWHLARTDAGPLHWVANDSGTVRLAKPLERVSAIEAALAPRAQRDCHLSGIEPYSTTDNSDQSDPSARVEARAGPVVCRQSRTLLSISRLALSSRTRSSSAPRAPPLVLRLA